MTYADKYVHQASDIPTEHHWAIITSSSIYIPGDERSRTNPGHGYPAENQRIVEYEAYLTEEKWIEAIEELESKAFRESYIALEVHPAKIKSTLNITTKVTK